MSFFLNLFPAHREAGAEILPSEGRLPPFEGATGWNVVNWREVAGRYEAGHS